jgi:hypothetical protein
VEPDVTVKPPMGWISLGPMPAPRAGHTATLLVDGRVLVAGGESDGDGPALGSAEIFDPTTRSWTPTGAMTVPRSDHHAFLLPDGRVVAIGGTLAANAAAETWDPSTGRWTAIAVPGLPPTGTAAVLADGRVLLAGGFRGRPALLDPTTGSLVETGPFSETRYNLSLIPLRDGSALAIGGDRVPDRGKTEVERFDPATNGWSVVGSLLPDTHSHGATVLDDGRILIVGAERGVASFAQLFDPATGETAVVPGAPPVWGSVDGERLADGRLLFVSSEGNGLFDPQSQAWFQLPAVREPRDPTITSLASGEVLVVGGRVLLGEDGTRFSSAVDLFGYDR